MMKEAELCRKNLAMALFDYCKAYDLVPHSWLIGRMRMFGITSNVEKMLLQVCHVGVHNPLVAANH